MLMSRITQGLLADEKELKMGKKSWEGSAKDTAQDKKLAKKHGMSMSAWEKSSMDTKHDKQQSTKGLRGGGIAVKGKGIALKHGGKVKKYADGGMMQAAVMPGGGVSGGPDPMVSGNPNVRNPPALGKLPLPGEGGGSIGGIGNVGRIGGIGNVNRVGRIGRGGLRPMPGPGGGGRSGGGMPIPMKKGGPVKEADSGEMYASKAAMKKHEAKESPAMEKSEHKRGGGIARKGKGIALRGGGIAQRGMGIALKGGGRAKGCM